MADTTSIDLTEKAAVVNLPGSGGNVTTNFGNFIGGMMSAIMALAALMALLFLIWGGVEWITSGGDKSKLEAARNKITNALLGLIVLAATTALFMLIQQFLDICVLNFGSGC